MGRVAILNDEKRWQAEEDMRTLRRAEEIKASRARLAAAKKIASEEVKAINKAFSPKPTRKK